MEWYTVASDAMTEVGYDAWSSRLQIAFANGSVYEYSGVPLQTFQELMAAESKGAFFDSQIRGRFPSARVG